MAAGKRVVRRESDIPRHHYKKLWVRSKGKLRVLTVSQAGKPRVYTVEHEPPA